MINRHTYYKEYIHVHNIDHVYIQTHLSLLKFDNVYLDIYKLFKNLVKDTKAPGSIQQCRDAFRSKRQGRFKKKKTL